MQARQVLSSVAAALFAYGGIHLGIAHDWTAALLNGFGAFVCLFGYRGAFE